MTMPNPVAEVVDRLRERTVDEPAAGRTWRAVPDPLCQQAADLIERQQAEIERLSRERDTGVPEGFWLAPNELDDAMIEACAGAFFAAFDKRVSGSRPFHRWYEAIRAAAPQPPTVSPDIVALTRERDQARADVNEWLDEIENFGLRRERLPEGALPWVEAAWRLGAQTVVRERDQAREALAWYGEQARLARLIHSEGDEGRHALAADGGKRARSVLHPEKEEKA